MIEDPLKGKEAKNGYFTGQQLSHYLSWCRNTSEDFIVALFNLCNLKGVNNDLGWEAGDRAIAESEAIIRSWFKDEQKNGSVKLFKAFGDKIHVVAYGLSRTWLAEKIWQIKRSKSKFELMESDGKKAPVYISFGYALSSRTSFDEILDAVDESLARRTKWWYRIKSVDYDRHHKFGTRHSSKALSITSEQHEIEISKTILRNLISDLERVCAKLPPRKALSSDSIKRLSRIQEQLADYIDEDSAA